ncbi:MAG TPA: DUF427 domain-containing protein [Acidimicrobiia bacterium]|jgi:uncharacterized protein (DUF427 family)|nr:DUF427 domain-containing protein [Acidimicrobiia bacterium]
MAKAIWNRVVLAESDETVMVEGNHYFPPSSISSAHFEANEAHTVCPWKGVANYFDIVVGDARNPGAAWTYPDPKPAAADIRDHVAFWRGVTVES